MKYIFPLANSLKQFFIPFALATKAFISIETSILGTSETFFLKDINPVCVCAGGDI